MHFHSFKTKGEGNSKGSDKGKGKAEKGSEKGKKGKNEKGKPKGKRATEFQQQPESEVGSEWSEPELENGGRLSMFSFDAVARPFFICQNMDASDPMLWLVDSGASRTVISTEALSAYRVLRERKLSCPIHCRTASGEQVHIDHECMLEVSFPNIIEHDDHDRTKLVKYEIRAVVGPVEHNLLSVSGLTRLGATFVYGPDHCHIRVGEIRRLDCEIWSSVPWIRAQHRKHRGKDHDIEITQSLALEPWVNESSDYEASKGDLIAWFQNNPMSDTSKDDSSDAQSPSKPSESPVRFPSLGQRVLQRGHWTGADRPIVSTY